MGIKHSSAPMSIHENIFHLPMGNYRKAEQTELNIKKIPALFRDLFELTYDKIVLILPGVSSYTISCLLPDSQLIWE